MLGLCAVNNFLADGGRSFKAGDVMTAKWEMSCLRCALVQQHQCSPFDYAIAMVIHALLALLKSRIKVSAFYFISLSWERLSQTLNSSLHSLSPLTRSLTYSLECPTN